MTDIAALPRLLFLILLYSIPAVAAVRPVTDFDIWWHIRAGQWIVEHRSVPWTDLFALPTMGQPWLAYSWLYELLVYGLYQALGLTGIVTLRLVLALLLAFAVSQLIARREPRSLVVIALTGAALLSMMSLLNERSWLFTILFSVWTLDVVLCLREGRSSRVVWLLPFVYVLWANIHIQFVYGLFLLGLGCAAPLLDRWLGRDEHSNDARTACSRGWWRLVVLTALCTLATLVNPYHVYLYGVIVEYATQPGPYRVVVELTATDFRSPWDWAVLALTCGAAFALGRRPKLSSFEVLLLIAATYLSFRMRRDVWLGTLAAVAILALAPRTAAIRDHFVWKRWHSLAVGGGIAAVVAATIWSRQLSPARLEAEVRKKFPVDAAAFVEEQRYPGPLYNHFNWGGYLIWRLPHLPVAVDGRTNLHGDARINRFEETWAGVPSWAHDPDLDRANVIIAEAGMPLASLLHLDQRFECVYQDHVAAVFVVR